ncbi:MAG TPA: MarR family transcriptional regulator [Firmicutes bacterium]|jgi:DNA-binding MarR family transcriptional regulator/GNAT superfamily N-acetyltransferase|nr:MarR family transcriptional regulator [Bacillota bacterium]
MNQQIISDIRRFNRFYTNIIGLLDQHILDSSFSLAEARILLEISQAEECTATKLMGQLKMDKGYLSRILKRFDNDKLIIKEKSPLDNRCSFLSLSEKGKKVFSKLNESSTQQIHSLIKDLSVEEQQTLVKYMKKTSQILSASTKPTASIEEIKIRHDLKPGDIGYLIYLHGIIYAKECNYNHQFEGYVAHTLYEFIQGYQPEKDRIWLTELEGEIMGTVAIIGHSKDEAQLRWFLIHPDLRGVGLGRRLLDLALDFCRLKNYRRIFLMTTGDQQTAIKMYTKAGFVITEEHPVAMWGKSLNELRYEMAIGD